MIGDALKAALALPLPTDAAIAAAHASALDAPTRAELEASAPLREARLRAALARAHADDAEAAAKWEESGALRMARHKEFQEFCESMQGMRAAHDAAAAAGVPTGRRLKVGPDKKTLEKEARKVVGGELIFDGGKFRRIADGDDTTPQATPFNAERHKRQREFAEAESSYLQTCIEETGLPDDPERIAKRQAERRTLREQSHELARRLEQAGKMAYRPDGFFLWKYHVHSKHREAIPQFRRICFLPEIAAQVRAPKLVALEYFIDRNPFARFWTFTSGKRVGLADLRDRISELHGRLNRLNTELRKRWGVEIVFRSTELGTVEFDESLNARKDSGRIEFDENGDPLFHVHTHCVVHSLRGFIKRPVWDKMVAWIWGYWGDHWDAGKIVKNARECCKYVSKPADLLRLTPEQLGRLHEALFKMRLVVPMGVLADEIRHREANHETLERKRTPDGMIWRVVKDHNAQLEQDEADRWAAAELRDAEKMADETKAAAKAEPGFAPSRGEKQDFCRVMARLRPAIGPLGLKEPTVIIGGTYFDDRYVANHPLVVSLWSETVQQWEAGRAISVHTGTVTSRDAAAFDWLADIPERVSPAGAPVWASAN